MSSLPPSAHLTPVSGSSYDATYDQTPVMRGLPPADAGPTFPDASYSMQFTSVFAVPADDRFVTFFNVLCDSHGRSASAIWYLTTLGNMSVYLGACIVNQYTKGTQAYAVVQDCIVRDATHVLFRVKIKYWVTPEGLSKPVCDTFAFLLAPVGLTDGEWSRDLGDYISTSAPGLLIHQLQDAIQRVKQATEDSSVVGLVWEDPLLSALAMTYRASPVMKYFAHERDFAVAVHCADLEPAAAARS
ncbi:unnamed protein product [Peniophora sp. CBMAI 1063]|nr:unnamed protein product [Peniophora sp. CBMAI 1063]